METFREELTSNHHIPAHEKYTCQYHKARSQVNNFPNLFLDLNFSKLDLPFYILAWKLS